VIPVNADPKRVILCIDDDPAILHYEKTLLERSGYSVLTASSAQQGLRLVTMCEFDAVLVDYEMLDMDGYEVAVEMKRIRPELTVILLSGGDVPAQALAYVDAFIHKLDASTELLPMIATLCSRISAPEQRGEGGRL
jgi:CheY-like chemotaxis protein